MENAHSVDKENVLEQVCLICDPGAACSPEQLVMQPHKTPPHPPK